MVMRRMRARKLMIEVQAEKSLNLNFSPFYSTTFKALISLRLKYSFNFGE